MVQRSSLGSLWEGSEVRDHLSGKKSFLDKRLFFCSFFLTDFLSFPDLSVLCLSHLLSMPQTWHMPSPCPHPSIHVFTCTNPGVHTLLLPPKLTFFVFLPHFPGCGGLEDTACVRIVRSECLKRYSYMPPSLPNYTSLCFELFVFFFGLSV